MPIIVLDHVSFGYDSVPVVSDISFAVDQGALSCVIGPSGSGKTTILRLVGGFLAATSGAVLVNGERRSRPSRDIAVVFQDYERALLPWRDVYGNVSLALEAAGVAKKLRQQRIEAMLELVGLKDHRNKYPAQLSGGMQQRVQIARCLAQDPKILLMDEPFGALDAMTRQILQDELLRIQGERGIAVLFVTHDLEEALYLGSDVVALAANPGRIRKLVKVPLPFPRHQLRTREHPEFLRLRHALFGLNEGHRG